jgi:hypothetical protein
MTADATEGALFTHHNKFQESLKEEYEASLAVLLPLKARLAATDRLIDQVVYQLYGLTEDEIAIIVEGKEDQ